MKIFGLHILTDAQLRRQLDAASATGYLCAVEKIVEVLRTKQTVYADPVGIIAPSVEISNSAFFGEPGIQVAHKEVAP